MPIAVANPRPRESRHQGPGTFFPSSSVRSRSDRLPGPRPAVWVAACSEPWIPVPTGARRMLGQNRVFIVRLGVSGGAPYGPQEARIFTDT